MLFAATWLDLQIFIVSEASQRKTNIVWHHLYVESKKDKNDLIYKTEVDSQTENKLMVTEGDGGISQEFDKIHVLPYIK